MSEYRMSVWQDGMEVAAVSGPDLDRVHAEAMHYAFVYGQDGPTEIRGIPAEKFEWLKEKLNGPTPSPKSSTSQTNER